MNAGSFCVPDDLLDTHIREFLESQPGPDIRLAWQGGEPTLIGLAFFRLASECIQKYRRPGVHIEQTIQTDGSELTSEWCEFFHRHKFLVGLTLDGPGAVYDLYRLDDRGRPIFEHVLRAARLLKAHRVEFNVLAAVHGGNGDYPLEMYRFLRDEIGARFIQLVPVVERATPETLTLEDLRWERRGSKRMPDRPRLSGMDLVPVSPEQWGRFLIGTFDEWVRRDVGTVFVEMFDSALASWVGAEALSRYVRDHRPGAAFRGDYLKSRFINAPDSEPGLTELCSGYQAFFEHADRPMRLMADLLRRGGDLEEVMEMIGSAASIPLPVRRSYVGHRMR